MSAGSSLPSASTDPARPAYFDEMFATSDDPWKFRSRWYERRKRALTLAVLPSERYQHGFEPGCANGELSARLATRCHRLLVSDGTARAVALAKERLKEFRHVEVRNAWVPDEWPADQFDLIVLSEFLFYLQPQVIEDIAKKAQATLLPDGVILACHWRRPVEHCPVNGDDVHALLGRVIQLPNQCQMVEPDFRVDMWSAGPTVAQREGLK